MNRKTNLGALLTTLSTLALSAFSAAAIQTFDVFPLGSIQAAVTAAGAYKTNNPIDDVVVVIHNENGETYHESNISVGAIITIRTSNPEHPCTIDCDGNGHAFATVGGTTLETVVDGFTITGGLDNHGAGIQIETSFMTIKNCIFDSNTADGDLGDGKGGAISIINGFAHIENCTFSSNEATGGSGLGGAIFFDGYDISAGADIIHCYFNGNSASGDLGGWGGAIYGTYGGPNMNRCSFNGNFADAGGAMWLGSTGCECVNSLFVLNHALTGDGGAISSSGTNVILRNCTVADNCASGSGGGIWCGGAPSDFASYNTFVWHNTAPSGSGISSTVSNTFAYSDVQDGAPAGVGNKSTDPSFEKDNTPYPAGSYRLYSNSLLINAGSDTVINLFDFPVDLDGSNRNFHNDGVDMGCYEYHVTPLVAAQQLRVMLDGLVLTGKMLPANGKSLKGKLDEAIHYIEIGDPTDARGSVNAFKNQVNAMVNAKRLTSIQAQPLINQAQMIIDLLSP